MDAGKLDTRVEVKRLTKTSDGFGGTTSTSAVSTTIWANKKEIKGEIVQENGKRQQYLEIELLVRKKTADNILKTDLLKIADVSGDYRISEIFDSVHKYYTTIKAVKIG
jgi:head-tail adaptor